MIHLSYDEFIIENNSELRIYYSDSFRDILRKISIDFNLYSNEYLVAESLLNLEDSDQLNDKYTLIDITDKNDTISFMQSNRIIRKYKITDNKIGNNILDKNHELWSSKSRTNINLGRWVRRIMIEVYKTNKYSDSIIESFVNAYKSTFDLTNQSKDSFQIVEGEDIRKWYLESNYSSKRGQLGNSCMRNEQKQKYLDIYVKNPKVCKLLIMKDPVDIDKIGGRSLLWVLEDGRLYQDRIYTNNDSDIILFERWAKDKNYLLYKNINETISVSLDDHSYNYYPYMDTFVVYNPKIKILSNDEDLWPGQGYIKIMNTDGTYQSDIAVWSNYYESYIEEESAIECYGPNGTTDWLEESDAIYLSYKDEFWVPCDEIVWSDFHESNFHIDDVVHSEKMNTYLWVDSDKTIEIILNSDNDTDYVAKSRPEFYIEVDGKYYDRYSYIKDPYTDKYIFRDDMIGDYTYNRQLLIKLESEFGKDKDLLVERVIKIFKDGEYPDIKDYIKNSNLYNSIWGVYWGLSKNKRPTEDDMICMLFAAIIGSTDSYFPSYIKQFNSEVYTKYNIWSRTDSRLISRINRFIKSFDYTLLGDKIYKLYLCFSL